MKMVVKFNSDKDPKPGTRTAYVVKNSEDYISKAEKFVQRKRKCRATLEKTMNIDSLAE